MKAQEFFEELDGRINQLAKSQLTNDGYYEISDTTLNRRKEILYDKLIDKLMKLLEIE
ncbi:MAG: hypothetical protein Q7R33_01050 [Nitrosarchaeum sp.]|nr:hypothetical protein [Nitrosarchaeum sp.]